MLFLDENYQKFDDFLLKNDIKNIFLVCGASSKMLKIGSYFENLTNRLNVNVQKFSDFEPNPDFESVKKGIALFKEKDYDLIFALGGGSAIDVAKCIKYYSKSNLKSQSFGCPRPNNLIKLAALPTTAGTGSEATTFAVVYINGEKKSINAKELLPDYVFFDETTLYTLPDYQKKCTYLDALCHAIESWWAVGGNEESKIYSKEAVKRLLNVYPKFLSDTSLSRELFIAANLAGKAINIAKTTAAHAMSYKLTSLYKIAHGQAVALCLPYVWEELIHNSKGNKTLIKTLNDIASAFNCNSQIEAVKKFKSLFDSLNLKNPKENNEEKIKMLTNSVNIERLSNFPITLNVETIENIYKKILF